MEGSIKGDCVYVVIKRKRELVLGKILLVGYLLTLGCVIGKTKKEREEGKVKSLSRSPLRQSFSSPLRHNHHPPPLSQPSSPHCPSLHRAASSQPSSRRIITALIVPHHHSLHCTASSQPSSPRRLSLHRVTSSQPSYHIAAV